MNREFLCLLALMLMANIAFSTPMPKALSVEEAKEVGLSFKLGSGHEDYECVWLVIDLPEHLEDQPDANIPEVFLHQVQRETGNPIAFAQLQPDKVEDGHQVETCFMLNQEYQTRISFYYGGHGWTPISPDPFVIEDLDVVYEHLVTINSNRRRQAGAVE